MEKKKRHISFSEFRLFDSCEFKHYLNKTLGYGEPKNEFLVFGSALHAAIEDIINKKISKILYNNLFQTKLKAESEGLSTSPFFLNKLSQQGVDILKKLDFQDRFKEYEVFGCEYQLYEKLAETDEEELYFKGIVDLILKKDDKYIILDWKSAGKPWDIEKKKEDKWFFGQLVLYKYFLSQKFSIPLENIETRFVCLSRDPVQVQQYDIELTPEFCEEVLVYITEVAKRIGATKERIKSRFVPEKKSSCSLCFFNKGKFCDMNAEQIVLPRIEVEIKKELDLDEK